LSGRQEDLILIVGCCAVLATRARLPGPLFAASRETIQERGEWGGVSKREAAVREPGVARWKRLSNSEARKSSRQRLSRNREIGQPRRQRKHTNSVHKVVRVTTRGATDSTARQLPNVWQ
jgi:hypothetical protein